MLRLLVRAGYARFGSVEPSFLFAGERSLNKIADCLLLELAWQRVAFEGSLRAAAGVARGELRSYKQLPQVWTQRRGTVLEIAGFGVEASAIRAALGRGLAACRVSATVDDPEGEYGPEAFHTPSIKTIAELAEFTGLPETSFIKSVVMSAGGALVLALVRGDHALSEAKLRALVGDARAATAEEIRAVFGADPGSLGPVGLSGVRVLADEALRGRRNLIAGANRDDYHLRNVTPDRDFTAEFHKLRVAAPGDGTPVLSGREVLGAVQAWAADLLVLNESGSTYAPSFVFAEIALDRVLAVAAGRDESGLVMPKRIAPFSVAIVPVNVKDAACMDAAITLYEQASFAGCDAVLDDRDERPGVKFKDCELVGIPWRVTVGKKLAEGVVEVVERSGKQSWDVAVSEAVEFVRRRWDEVV